MMQSTNFSNQLLRTTYATSKNLWHEELHLFIPQIKENCQPERITHFKLTKLTRASAYIIVPPNEFCCRVQNKISTKGQRLLVKRCSKGTINADKCTFAVAQLWNFLYVNTSEERICWRLSKEKRNLHGIIIHSQLGMNCHFQGKHKMII